MALTDRVGTSKTSYDILYVMLRQEYSLILTPRKQICRIRGIINSVRL